MWFQRDWVLIDKTVLPSGFEQMKAYNVGKFKADDAESFLGKLSYSLLSVALPAK